MNYYTVKQLAEAFNVSVQAIHREIKKKQYIPYISKQKIGPRNTIVLNEKCLNYLNQHFKPIKQVDNQTFKQIKHSETLKTNNLELYNLNSLNQQNQHFKEDLIKQLNNLNQHFKNNQTEFKKIIDNKNEIIKLLQKELDKVHIELQHEQELHLMDQKQVKTLENKIKELQQPKQKSEEKQQIVEEHKKHWWQFWK